MRFEYPIWLVVMAAALPLIFWALRQFSRSRAAALKTFAAEHLLKALTANVSMVLRVTKRWLFAIAVALCLIALARPQAGFRWQEVKRKGIDIVFAVDTSKSMLAQDVSPNRLTRAKLAVLDLVEKLQGDRVGLIAFAGSAFLQSPLTLDYDAFGQSLDALDTSIIPKGGTDIASAIREAQNAFSLGGQNHQILVILTDGEDLEANGITAAREAAKNGMRIFTVGVGSTTGELIPIQNEQGGVEFLKDEKGQPVRSRLDESTLRQIAAVTGGAYKPLGQQGQGLDAIYKHGLAELPKQELASRMNKIYIERFQWPLALAVLLLVIEMMLGERRIQNSKFKIQNFLARKRQPIVAALLLMMLATGAWASPQSAEKAYLAGKYPEAVTQYKEAAAKEPKKTELQYNLGDATYKSQSYADASAEFQKALKTGKVDLQQQTFYNLGNTQYRIGQQTEKTNPQQTIETWKQALASYESAMQLKKDDADAKFNYEFVKKKLEELQKQQQQKQDQNKDQDKDKNKDQNKDKNKDQNKDQQNKDQKKDEKNEDHNKDQQGQNKDQKQEPKNDQNKDQQKQNQDQNKDQKKDSKENHGEQPKPQDQQDQAKQQNGGAGDQQKKDQGQQDQGKNQDGKKDQQKEQQQAGGKPDDKKGGNPEEKEVQLLPGQMSKEEAKNLLDSLKGDEKKMPVSIGKTEGARWEDTPRRDW